MRFITVCFGTTKRNSKKEKGSDAVFRDEPKQGSCNLEDLYIKMYEINSNLKAVLFSLPQTSLQSVLDEFRQNLVQEA